MMFNKDCTTMPKKDMYSTMDMNQSYYKNEHSMYNMPMKDGNCGCGCKKEMEPMTGMGMCGCKMQPVYEQPIEKCVHRTICHEVPHVCPINTRIINHHVYRHTYSPCYSCCEENQVSQVNEGSCCCFR